VPGYAGSERAAGQRTPGGQRADQPAARRRGCDAPLASRLSLGLTAPLTVTAARPAHGSAPERARPHLPARAGFGDFERSISTTWR